jgi:hypothetical protein
MVNNSHLIKPSGKKYAILWGHRVEEFSDYSDAVYAKVFNGSEWSATTQLNTDASNNTQFQLASDGRPFRTIENFCIDCIRIVAEFLTLCPQSMAYFFPDGFIK